MSDEKKFLIPVPGKLVLDPSTHVALKAEGEWKPWNTAWARVMMFGDAVEGKPMTENVAIKIDEIHNQVDETPLVEQPLTFSSKRQRKGFKE